MPAPLDRFYLCARVQMVAGRPVEVVRAVLTGRQLEDADTRLRRLTRAGSAWICLRELADDQAPHLAADED